jgi:hypothetical protein
MIAKGFCTLRLAALTGKEIVVSGASPQAERRRVLDMSLSRKDTCITTSKPQETREAMGLLVNFCGRYRETMGC